MHVKLFDSVKQQLEQLTVEINKPNEENETLSYLYQQGLDESTSLKGDDYKNLVSNLFGGRGSAALKDFSGESKHSRYQTKAREREEALKIISTNIAQTIANAEFEPDQLQILQQLVAQKIMELKKFNTYIAAQDAIDKIYQPITDAINVELQPQISFKI